MRKTLHSKAYKRLTDLLTKTRNDAGLTQRQVADKLDKTQSFVAKYENGERRLDVIEFIEVAKVLQADPVELIEALNCCD